LWKREQTEVEAVNKSVRDRRDSHVTLSADYHKSEVSVDLQVSEAASEYMQDVNYEIEK